MSTVDSAAETETVFDDASATEKALPAADVEGAAPLPALPEAPLAKAEAPADKALATQKHHPLRLNPGKSWKEWRRETLGGNQMLCVLLGQAFSAGLLDAFAYGDFQTFASNQTGNIILLTLAAVGTVPVLLLMTGVSLGAFALGAFIAGHAGTAWGPRRRSWLLTTTGIQMLMLVVACVLWSPAAPAITRRHGKHEWIVMLLLAFMSGMQVTSARQSKCQEVPTAPMTSPMVDFVTDPHLFDFRTGKTGPRNRRAAYLSLCIIGSLLGAVIHRFLNAWAIVVFSVGVKLCVMAMICLLKASS